MKNCVKCTYPLNDDDKFCSICGAEQTVKRKANANFCVGCGASITHNNQYCSRCGKPVRNEQVNQIFKNVVPPMIKALSSRITLTAVLWIVIASLHLFCGLFLLCVASLTFDWNTNYINAMKIYFASGGLNLPKGIGLLKYKKTILTDYVGIVRRNRICFSSSIDYMLNACVVFMVGNGGVSLFFALLTASAIIIDFVSIKVFVSKNKESFLLLEKSQITEE